MGRYSFKRPRREIPLAWVVADTREGFPPVYADGFKTRDEARKYMRELKRHWSGTGQGSLICLLFVARMVLVEE